MEVLEIGSLYEIDHTKLHQQSPVQLRSIRVAMVVEKNDKTKRVTVRYPSLDSLKAHLGGLSDLGDDFGSHGRTRSCYRALINSSKLLTLLDEKYDMRAQIGRAVLHRKITSEEWSKHRQSWRFWSMTEEKNRGPCLADYLKRDEIVKWGRRHKIQFIGRHKSSEHDDKSLSVADHQTDTETVDDDEVEEEIHEDDDEVEEEIHEDDDDEVKSINSEDEDEDEEVEEDDEEIHEADVKPKNPGDEEDEVEKESESESDDDEDEDKIKQRKRKRKHAKIKTKKPRRYNYKVPRVPRPTIKRWSEERFKQAEEFMLQVMKAKGAVAGNPIMRLELRNEARKLIGDTGLLDHLLKHLAGRVAPGGAERFRRRHNPEGAMEYWLESADLLKIRKDAGVQDPYWIPPPGWKPGDNPTQDPIFAMKMKELKAKMIQMERDMEEMKCRKEDENQLAMVTTPSSCVVNQIEHVASSWVPTKEMVMELVKKNDELGEQVMQISRSLKEMERDIQKLKSSTTATAAVAVKQAAAAKDQENHQKSISSNQTLSLVAFTGTENEDANNQKGKPVALKSEEENPNEDQDLNEKVLIAAIKASEKAAMVQRLKSGFRICRPQGSFLWPSDMSTTTSSSSPSFALSSPVVPTPPSCHSSTTNNNLLLPPPPPPTRPSRGATSYTLLDLNSVPISENLTSLSAYSSSSLNSSISDE